MEFTVALVDAAAWPVAVLVLAILFRGALHALASGEVRRWKAGPSGVEFEYWDHEAAAVKEAVREELPSAIDKAFELESPLIDQLHRVAQETPAAAIIQAFATVEAELRRIVVTGGPTAEAEASRMSARRLAVLALDADLITPESASAIEGLTVLRNLSAHGQAHQLDAGRAAEYLLLADAVMYALRNKA